LEFDNHRNKGFDLFTKDSNFTDDTVCTIGVADFDASIMIKKGIYITRTIG